MIKFKSPSLIRTKQPSLFHFVINQITMSVGLAKVKLDIINNYCVKRQDYVGRPKLYGCISVSVKWQSGYIAQRICMNAEIIQESVVFNRSAIGLCTDSITCLPLISSICILQSCANIKRKNIDCSCAHMKIVISTSE